MTYRKPQRIFEDSGSVNPKEAYYVPLDNVTNTKNQDIKTMVDQGRFFSIFAPRQSGKTTFLKRFCQELEKDNTYVAILLSFETYSSVDIDTFYSQIQESLYEQLIERLTKVKCDKTGEVKTFLDSHDLKDHVSFGKLFKKLNGIIKFKKIVIFIDEFDGIPLKEIENFLTAIRDLYLKYKESKQKALYSIGLMGIRNITKLVVGGVSPFNIADQVDMPPFSLKNVEDLFAQYTAETNQYFSTEAIQLIHQKTGGQPWLVNRLGTILTVNIKPETVESINENDVEKAVEHLLYENNVHFDNLYEKSKLYKETFVEIVFDGVRYSPNNEDQGWLKQYGLIKESDRKAIVANEIYKSRFLATFFEEVDANKDISLSHYLLDGKRLDMERIIFNFEKYIAQIGVNAFYEEKKPYEKTGQFLLTAWLYQFVKGGNGEVRYELKSGLGRMDILLTYKGFKYIIETKVNRHDEMTGIINEEIKQLTGKYLATEKTSVGYLVVFDTQTSVGVTYKPQYEEVGDKKIAIFRIAIGKVTQ